MTKTKELPIVLIVVANRYKSAQLKKALKNCFSIFEVEESFGAVEWLKYFQASVIIIDEEALTKTWPAFVEHIRKLPNYIEVPVFLISSNIKKTFLSQAIKCGVSDFLHEPLDSDEIYERILVHLKKTPVTKRVEQITKKIPLSHLKTKGPALRPFFVTEEVIRRISESRTHQLPMALVMIEIDRYPSLEQLLSAEENQELLQTLHALIQSFLRKNDYLLPQGKGRFLLIFPRTSERAAVSIAEIIREEVEATSFALKKHTPNVTLSMGLIAYDKESEPKGNIYDRFDTILGKVDRALTEAKGQGNKIVTIKKRTL